MKTLSLNIAKNVALTEISFTPNTVVLAKQTTNVNPKTGDVTTTVRYIEVCPVEKTDKLAIVKSLLRYCVAEFLVCNDLEKSFADTNIKQQKLFNQFLSGDKIYRTNSEGKIADALISEVPLNRTALKVKDYHTIATCKPENRKAAIHQHASAIVAQCQYRSMIVKKAETLEAEAAETTPATATAPAKPVRPRTAGVGAVAA